MKPLLPPTLLVASSLALTATFQVHGQEHRAYVKADLGGNITENTDLKEFFGPVTPGSRVKFDPGVRAGLGGGYWLTEWLAAEGEIGVMGNRIKSITDATELHDAYFENVPFL